MPTKKSDGGTYKTFADFHQSNPDIYKKLLQLTRGIRDQGFNHFDIPVLWKIIPWHLSSDPDAGRYSYLSEEYVDQYARLILKEQPDLGGLFLVREPEPDIDRFMTDDGRRLLAEWLIKL